MLYAENLDRSAFTVIVPFHNEGPAVDELIGSIISVMGKIGQKYEIIAINDGSTDDTGNRIGKIASSESRVIPVNFPEKRGQTAALAEGFRMAEGSVVITMDGDMQDDPEEIPGMLRVMRESGADVVCGWRRYRNDPAAILSVSSLGNFFQRLFFNVPVHDISCTFRVYKSEAVKDLELTESGLHRFLPFIIKRAGYSLAEKEVHHRPRKYGTSKYTYKKVPQTVRLFWGLLTGKF